MSKKHINVMRPTDEGNKQTRDEWMCGVCGKLVIGGKCNCPDVSMQGQLAAAQAENAELRRHLAMKDASLKLLESMVIDLQVKAGVNEHLKAKLAESEKRCNAAETVLGKLGWDLTAAGWRDSRAPDSCAGCPNEYLKGRVDLEELAKAVYDHLRKDNWPYDPALRSVCALKASNMIRNWKGKV